MPEYSRRISVAPQTRGDNFEAIRGQAMSLAPDVRATEITRLRDLSPTQLRSGIAAWLGWLFDGLDMHLYTLVATPFVAQLLMVEETDKDVKFYTTLIQAAFLV